MDSNKIKIINNKYCTLDNIEIRTIYIENIPQKQANYECLKSLFSKYGDIVNIEIEKIYKIYTGDSKGSATIQYEKSDQAYKAICEHKLNDIEITFADSWKQPNNDVEIKPILEFDAHFALDQMNDDCLLEIYPYLQLQDQLGLARISNHQKSILRSYYKIKKELNISNMDLNKLTLHEIRNFLIENGELIESLNLISYWFEAYCPRLFSFALQFCPNLKIIKICGIHFKFKAFSEKISTLYSDMKILRLNDCRISNEDIMNISKLSKLEVLDLSGSNNDFDGSNFDKFKNLKQLDLEHNCDFSEDNFLKSCYNFHNLKILNIIDVESLHSSRCINAIVSNCKNLEHLKISIFRKDLTEIGKKLSKLNHLKGLTVHNSNPRGCTNYLIETPNLQGFLTEISKTTLSENLEILEFPYCIFNEENLVEIGKFKNLKSLMICLKSNEISEKFWITMAIIINNLRSLSIRIGSYNTSYKEFCIKFVNLLKTNKFDKFFQLICDMRKAEFMEISENVEYSKNKDIIEIIPFYLTNLPTSFQVYDE